MSLVAFAIRICLQKALAGKTLAEDRIFDSMVTPLDVKAQEESLPIITVSTDDDESTTCLEELNTPGSRRLDVILELACANFVTVKEGTQVTIPHTDAGLEAALNFMHRQAYRAIMDQSDPWAALLRAFMSSVEKVLVRRGAGSDKGVRFAARQILFTTNPLFEPDFGVDPDPDGIWGILIAMMAADSEFDDLAIVLRSSIVGDPLPSWRAFQVSQGMSDLAIEADGLSQDTVPATEATLAAGDDSDPDASPFAVTLAADQPSAFEP